MRNWFQATSHSAFKELGSSRSNLTTSKKLNILKNQQLFLDPQKRGENTWQTSAPKIGETDSEYRVMTYQSRNALSWNDLRNQRQGRKTGPVIDELLEAQYGQLWELKTPGDPVIGAPPRYREIRFQELAQVPTVNVGEKSSPASSRRRGKYARTLRAS